MTLPRIHSIDLLKVIAMLLVINSHMAKLYGDMAVLATGGAIGDAFFFFCAGYLMELKHRSEVQGGRQRGFWAFLGNRIWRIYPTVWLWAAFLCLGLGWQFDIMKVLDGDCWFVGCIMIYYVLLWCVQRFLPKRKMMLMVLVFIATIGFYFVEGEFENGIYGYCHLRWLYYFLPMLFGSWLAEKQDHSHPVDQVPIAKRWSMPMLLGLLLLSVVVYYALAAFKLCESLAVLQLFSLPALLAVTYCGWTFCNFSDFNSLASSRMVRWLSSICLEAYIIQWSIITICYRLDPWYGWLIAWILILTLATLFHQLVKWVRLIFNYIF